ncbi:alcohol dehydrogenase catalytic domain-containing protein [Nocardioides aurantiacus]|uniref:alcohol dehydrogenase catalytic domain-containing protein n=1 Tax=Nocardioides aurantiacus TaxID=86796 RepID=UPI00403F5B1B
MRAVVYRGVRQVSVEDVPDARIEDATDAVVRITTTNICGSDLHMYEGRAGVEEGKVLGHENMGIVEDVGPGVNRVRVGDRVSVPFNIACGSCRSCVEGWTSFCERTNPVDGMQGAAYGYANMGPYDGGLGTDRGVEAVGWQAHDPQGDEHPELVLDNLVQVVKAHGGIGVIGVYVPQDPGAPDELAAHGRVAFDYGTFFTKGQQMGTGQAPVKRSGRSGREAARG